MCPPHSPTRITKKSILKLPGAFHWPKTSRILFWAFSYSIGEPCGRSDQLITYFMSHPSHEFLFRLRELPHICKSGKPWASCPVARVLSANRPLCCRMLQDLSQRAQPF